MLTAFIAVLVLIIAIKVAPDWVALLFLGIGALVVGLALLVGGVFVAHLLGADGVFEYVLFSAGSVILSFVFIIQPLGRWFFRVIDKP